MNPALVLTHNNLSLTKQCVASLRNQDIPVQVYIVDNGSTDDTVAWAQCEGILLAASSVNSGFSRGINYGLELIFGTHGIKHCLCPGSDTIMPPSYYRTLLELDLPAVSGVQDIDGHRVTMDDLTKPFSVHPINPNPDFSCLLWNKEAWESLGGLDETMTSYASDCDLHIRAHRMGVKICHAQVPFFHYGSSTIKNASPKEKRVLNLQADADRVRFKEKWGFDVGSPQYAAQFVPENFGIDKL